MDKCPHCGEEIEKDQGPIKVITVRMPLSLHERLTECSHREHVSMNKFCVDALLSACCEHTKEQAQ